MHSGELRDDREERSNLQRKITALETARNSLYHPHTQPRSEKV